VQEPKSGNDVLFAHPHRFLHPAAKNSERQLSYGEGQEAVGHTLGTVQGDRMPGLQGPSQLGGTVRFYPDDPDCWIQGGNG
jgi:hypothetical protein